MADASASASDARRLLLVYAGRAGGRTERLVQAAREGIAEAGAGLELRALPALAAGIDDLLWAHGVLLATPEHFGYMAGALKDFFDRTFYPAEGRTEGLPYALCVAAGTDGSGTVAAVTRIVTGYRWKAIAEPLVVIGDATPAQLAACRDRAQTLAAGLLAGLW